MIAETRIQSMGASSQACYLCRQLIKEKEGVVNMITKLRPVGDHVGF